jgi:hypothetical protein
MEQRTRIALSLKPELDGLISELAKLTQQTKTSVITGILKDMSPVLKKTVAALKRAQEGKDDIAISMLQDLMSDTEKQFKEAQIELEGLGAKNDGN